MSENLNVTEEEFVDPYAEYSGDDVGLKQQTVASTIFLNIKHTGICEEYKVQPRDPEFRRIKVNNPSTETDVTKWIKEYESVAGFIDKIEYSAREYDDGAKVHKFEDFKVHINMLSRVAILAFKIESRQGERFMKLARNINYRKPVEFRAWKDGNHFALYVAQNGQKVEEFFHKDHPNLPKWVERVNRKGEKEYDKDEYYEFLVSDVRDKVAPVVEQIAEQRNASPTIQRLVEQKRLEFEAQEEKRMAEWGDAVREAEPEIDVDAWEDSAPGQTPEEMKQAQQKKPEPEIKQKIDSDILLQDDSGPMPAPSAVAQPQVGTKVAIKKPVESAPESLPAPEPPPMPSMDEIEDDIPF